MCIRDRSAILELHPDLAMLDIEMPDCSGIDIASRVLKRGPVSYTHLRAHETPEHLVCRLLLEKKKKQK